MQCLLDILEKKNILKVGKYDILIQIFEDSDVRIVENVIQPAQESIKRILDMKHNDEDDTSSSNFVSLDKSSEQVAQDDNDMALSLDKINKAESANNSDTMDTLEQNSGESTSCKQLPSCSSASKTHNEINSVGDILRFLGFERYINQFEDEEVDIDSFWTLKGEDLQRMGVKIGPSSKIMKYIEENAKSSIFQLQSTMVSKQLYPFQRELLEIPLSGENTIVYARTNAGKTLIAFTVIAEHLEKNPEGKVLFTARTNLLLDQQFQRAQDFFLNNKKIDLFCLRADEDRTEYTFSNVMKVYNVFFMTPQLFVNNLSRNDDLKVNIDEFTLLVFDECHHTMGFDAYNNVMGFYRLKKFQSTTPNSILPQT
ncbi:uncharacterized protein LOC134687944 [Mytilus trossulus]|uniref:uncharacterized protein LOC134687944 n=1 Tax=Mytilus trossulus TaxID=6551 RepID=UPI0030044475